MTQAEFECRSSHAADGFRVRNPNTDHLWVEVGPQLSGRTMLWGPLFVELALVVPFRVLAPTLTYRDMDGDAKTAFSVVRAGLSVDLGEGVRF